ncbi:MAG: DNA-binding protein [Oscillospiraceae bacterium]|nr:DNA-binding protein [Oscillospiraceae bacterium]
MKSEIISVCGNTKYHCIRLRRGEDLLKSIQKLCAEQNIGCGTVLSGVGCISKGRIRDASGITIREINEDCEIVSLNGTVSSNRCHLHVALSKEDLSTIGGHLCEGCIINTTCELIIAEIPGIKIEIEDDPETGYDELIFKKAE